MQPLCKLKLMKENRPCRLDNKSSQLSVPKVLSRLCLQPGAPLSLQGGPCLSPPCCRMSPMGHWAPRAANGTEHGAPLILDFLLQAASVGPGSCQAPSTVLNDLFQSYLRATSQLWRQFSCLRSAVDRAAFPSSLKSVFNYWWNLFWFSLLWSQGLENLFPVVMGRGAQTTSSEWWLLSHFLKSLDHILCTLFSPSASCPIMSHYSHQQPHIQGEKPHRC